MAGARGAEAERIFALTAAAQHWQRAIALWDDVADAESIAGLSFFDAYVKTRDALSDSGDDVGAGALTEAVFRRLGSSVTGDLAVRMFGASATTGSSGPDAGSDRLCNRHRGGPPLTTQPGLRPSTAEICPIVHGRGDYSTSDDLIERALTAARAGGFPDLEKELLAVHAESLVDRGLFAPARDRIEQSMRVRLVDPPNITMGDEDRRRTTTCLA